VPYKDLKAETGRVDSALMRSRVLGARTVQTERFAGTNIRTNSQLSGKALGVYCPIGEDCHRFLEMANQRLGLSARAHTRILRLARTIADLDSMADIRVEHLAEAINYRNLAARGRVSARFANSYRNSSKQRGAPASQERPFSIADRSMSLTPPVQPSPAAPAWPWPCSVSLRPARPCLSPR